MGLIVNVYRDGAGEWRWTASDSGNHEPMSQSSEGYRNKRDAISAAQQTNPDDAEYHYPADDDPEQTPSEDPDPDPPPGEGDG